MEFSGDGFLCLGLALIVGEGVMGTGCSGDSWVVADSKRSFGDGEAPQQAPPDLCPESAVDRLLDSECWPTQHIGEWRGFVADNPLYRGLGSESVNFPEPAIHLSISEKGGATWKFGGAQLEVSPSEWQCFLDPSGADCSVAGRLLSGVSYDLGALRMYGGDTSDKGREPNVAFSLPITEPWRPWCESASDERFGVCSCDEQACEIVLNVLEVKLNLSADGESMRGTARSQRGGRVEEARLELLRL